MNTLPTTTTTTTIKMTPIKASSSAQDFVPKRRRRFQRRNSKTSFMMQAAFQTSQSCSSLDDCSGGSNHSCSSSSLGYGSSHEPSTSKGPGSNRRRFQRRNSKTSFMLQEALKTSGASTLSSFGSLSSVNNSSSSSFYEEPMYSPGGTLLKNASWDVQKQGQQPSRHRLLKKDVANRLLSSMFKRTGGPSSIKQLISKATNRGDTGSRGKLRYNDYCTEDTESCTEATSGSFLCDDFSDLSFGRCPQQQSTAGTRCAGVVGGPSAVILPTSEPTRLSPLPTSSSASTLTSSSVLPENDVNDNSGMSSCGPVSSKQQRQAVVTEEEVEEEEVTEEDSVDEDEEMVIEINDEPSRLLPSVMKDNNDDGYGDGSRRTFWRDGSVLDETARRELLLDNTGEFQSMLERCRGTEGLMDDLDEEDDEDEDEDTIGSSIYSF